MTHPGWGDKWTDAPELPARTSRSSTRPVIGGAPFVESGPVPRVDGTPGTVVRSPRPASGGTRVPAKVWQKPPEPKRALWTQRRRRNLRIALGWLGGAAGVLLVLLGLVAFDSIRARAALADAATEVARLRADAVAGRTENLDVTVAALQEDAGRARAATSGPHWAIAGRLPGAGPTVAAVATMADVVDDLANGPLPDLAGVVRLASPATFAPVDGRVDLGPLQQVAPDVVRADESIGAALQRVTRLDGTMLPPVREAVTQLRGQLEDVRMTSATASRAARLIPPMLGADGPRDYLVLVQNNAEPRALGGIVGSVLVLRAEGGVVSLVQQMPGQKVGPFPEPVVPLSEDEQLVLADEEMARWMQNVTMTPDFPRAAQVAREMWKAHTGQEVGGVLAVDPVLLADLLAVSGPIDTGPGGMLQGDALVDYLLDGVYRTQEPSVQDAIFADVAKRAFETLSAGTGDSVGLINALAIAAREGRLLVWSADRDEEDLLAGTVLDGGLRGVKDESPVVGVFTQGLDAAKIGYYLDTAVDVVERETRPDGSRELEVTVRYTSRVDAAEVGELPTYVTGPDPAHAGEIRIRSLVYAPAGGSLIDSTVNGEELGLSPQVHNALPVASRSVVIRPGETTAMSYAIITGKRQTGDVLIRVTPGARSASVSFRN